jgi:4-amino-4-deoxy-L-arabinose transferase-like glycosyltransferase
MTSIPSPAIVAQSVTKRLSRRVLWLFCLGYILPGFVGREPWKNADISAFAYMLELFNGKSAWLAPQSLGQAPEGSALLPYWLGAWAMQLSPPWLEPAFAVRLPFILLLVLTLLAAWQGVYYLARSPRALPVVFAFGGEAKPKDYARTIADGGLLALIACLGLAQFSHETTPALPQVCFTAIIFYAVSAMPYHRVAAALAFMVGLLGLTLSGAPSIATILGLGSMLIFATDTQFEDSKRDAVERIDRMRYGLWMLFCVICAALLATVLNLWRFTAVLPYATWQELQATSRLLLWFAWPAWPLAIWTLWRWRRQFGSLHVALPMLFVGAAALSMLFTRTSDRALLLGLPAMATLAAFALPTLERRLSALIDWFTLFFFSAVGMLIWGIWIAMQTGASSKSIIFVNKMVPGYMPSFSWLPFLVAIVGTLSWVYLVLWRVGRHRTAMWKSMVLPAGGTALCWLLLMTLWLPILDFARSYAPLVHRVAETIGKQSCVQIYGLSPGQAAAFAYHGSMKLQLLKPEVHQDTKSESAPESTPISTPEKPSFALADEQCPWLIVDADVEQSLSSLNMSPWRFVTKVRRPTDDNEDVLLYRRVN